MVDGIIFVLKAVLLIESLTNAVKNWGIFDPIRERIRRINFFDSLLSCFECTSVWVSFFVIPYLLFFEITLFTYLMIFHRLACFINLFYQFLDVSRAKKEKEL